MQRQPPKSSERIEGTQFKADLMPCFLFYLG